MAVDDLAAAARRLDAVAEMLTGDYRRLATAGATASTKEARAVAGDLGVMRNMGRGVRLAAGYDIEADGLRVVVRLRPPGAWVIAEQGARAHLIRPKRARRSGKGSGWGITPAVYGHGYDHPAAQVQHHGARGRRGIARAFGRARPAFTEAVHAAEVDRLRTIYAG